MTAHIVLYSSMCIGPTSSWSGTWIIDVFPAGKDTDRAGRSFPISQTSSVTRNPFYRLFLTFLIPCPFFLKNHFLFPQSDYTFALPALLFFAPCIHSLPLMHVWPLIVSLSGNGYPNLAWCLEAVFSVYCTSES